MKDQTKRRRARELALQVLFQKEFVQDVQIDISLQYFSEHLEIAKDSATYAETLLTGIIEHKSKIDELISEKSRNWKINRMSPVDLSLLRIGAFELCFSDGDVPPRVVIDESIELAKKYGGTDSPSFINGILDEIFKSKS